MEDKIICQKCGAINSTTNNFCSNCAAPLKAGTTSATQQTDSDVTQQQAIPPQPLVPKGMPKKKGKGCLITFLVILATIVITIVVSITSNGKGGSSGSAPSSNSPSSSSVAAQPKQSSSSKVTLKHFTGTFISGYYTAGVDFPAGTYTLTAVSGKGNVSSTNMYSGGLNAMMGVGSADLYEPEYKNIDLPQGVTLSISSVTIKMESIHDVNPSLKKRVNTATKEVTLTAGNYTAGTDFSVGTYDVIAIKGTGNVSSTNMYSGGLNAMMGVGGNDLYEQEYKNLEFKSGVILKISGVTIKMVPSK